MQTNDNFDTLCRAIAGDMPRREALRLLIWGTAGVVLTTLGISQAFGAPCPPGRQYCGSAGCVPIGTCCNSATGAVCPTSRCGTDSLSKKFCCPLNTMWVGAVCCPTARVCNSSTVCCPPGKVCVANTCQDEVSGGGGG